MIFISKVIILKYVHMCFAFFFFIPLFMETRRKRHQQNFLFFSRTRRRFPFLHDRCRFIWCADKSDMCNKWTGEFFFSFLIILPSRALVLKNCFGLSVVVEKINQSDMFSGVYHLFALVDCVRDSRTSTLVV